MYFVGTFLYFGAKYIFTYFLSLYIRVHHVEVMAYADYNNFQNSQLKKMTDFHCGYMVWYIYIYIVVEEGGQASCDSYTGSLRRHLANLYTFHSVMFCTVL